jgi:hypothetical protein
MNGRLPFADGGASIDNAFSFHAGAEAMRRRSDEMIAHSRSLPSIQAA